MKTTVAAKLKEQCSALLDRHDSEGLIVAEHGKPVACVFSYNQGSVCLFSSLEEKIEIGGELLTTGLRWNADARSQYLSSCPFPPWRTPAIRADPTDKE